MASGEPSPASSYFHQHLSQSPEQTCLVQDSGSPVTPTFGQSTLPIKRKPVPSGWGASPTAAADGPDADKRLTPSPESEPEQQHAQDTMLPVAASQQQQEGSAAERQTTVGEDELSPLAPDGVPPVAWLGQTSNMTPSVQWRPRYLRRRVFVAFICFFAACMVVIEALLAVSNRTNGLSSPGFELYYLWTFGPTAVLIVVSALWGRVEFQMMRYMPWIAMSRGPEPAIQTILVDYVSMASWRAIWKGMKHKNFLLVMTLVTAVLFKVQIVLSTSLLSLEQRDLTFEVSNVTTQRVFKDIASIQSTNSSVPTVIPRIPFVLLQASRKLGLQTPDGFADGIAYQTFEAPGVDPSVVLGVNVQAFAMDVDCIDAELTFNHPHLHAPKGSRGSYELGGNFSLKTSVCSDVFRYYRPLLTQSCATRSSVDLTDLWCLLDISLTALGIETRESSCFPRGSYLVARATFELQTTNSNRTLCNNTALDVTERLAVVCIPKYSLFTATVKKNATSVHSIEPREPREWKPLGGLRDLFEVAFLRGLNLGGLPVLVPSVPLPLLLGYDLLVGRISGDSRGVQFDRDTIKKSMRKAHQYVGAMFANTFLVEPVQGTTTGEARQNVSRLVVQPVTAHVMVGLFGIMLFFAAFMLFAAPRQLTAFTPRDPNTIIGTAALLANSQAFRESFHRSAHEGAPHLERRFAGSFYKSGYVVSPQTGRPEFIVVKSSEKKALPSRVDSGSDTSGSDAPNVDYYWAWCLHPAAQVAALVVLAGLIAALLALLHVSERNGGIADLTGRDETYLHYLWTSLPTLVMVGVSLFISCCNFETRLMVPFSRMKAGIRQDFSHTAGLSFLDELSVCTLFRMSKPGWRRHGTSAGPSIRVLLTTLMTMSAGVLTILTSTLYRSTEAGTDVAIQLQQQQWFAQEPNNAKFVVPDLGVHSAHIPNLITSMAVNWGLDYPKWTYEDILLPAFDVGPLPAGRPMPTSIRAKVPAVQPELLNCSLYLQTDDVRLTRYKDPKYPNYGEMLNVSVAERCFFIVNDIPSRNQFGVFLPQVYPREPTSLEYGKYSNCSDTVFFWGTRKFKDERDFAAVLLCNESASFVDVDVTFKYPSMLIDSTQPPVPDESTRRPYGPGELRSGSDGSRYALSDVLPAPDTVSTSTINFISDDYRGFAPFYYLLLDSSSNGNPSGGTQNRLGALPLSAFRGPDTAHEVVVAIKKAYNTVRVQTLNFGSGTRLYFNQTSPRQPFRQTAPPPIASTARLPVRRLVQEPVVTYLLVAVLALILLLHICSLWPQDRRIVPNNPMSLAAATSLLADSNVFECMPADGAHYLSDEQLARLFAGKIFRIGWFDDVKNPGSQTFTIRIFDADPAGADPAGGGIRGGVTEQMGPQAGDTSYRGAEGIVTDYQRPVAQPGGTWFPVQQRGWSKVSQDDRM